jgi:hypothetical protein
VAEDDEEYPQGWLPGSWLGRLLCKDCGQPFLYHFNFDLLAELSECPLFGELPPVPEPALWWAQSREQRGRHAAPLPAPEERRRIRLAAGMDLDAMTWAVAEEFVAMTGETEYFEINPDTVGRWERPAGYDSTGRRLSSGCEPWGERQRRIPEYWIVG